MNPSDLLENAQLLEPQISDRVVCINTDLPHYHRTGCVVEQSAQHNCWHIRIDGDTDRTFVVLRRPSFAILSR